MTLAGSKFSSIGQAVTLRSARPTNSPNKYGECAVSRASADTVTF